MGDGSGGNIGGSQGGQFSHCVQRHVAADFRFDMRRDEGQSPGGRGQVHVVEHDALRREAHGFAHMVESPAFDFQWRTRVVCSAQGFHGQGDGARLIDMVVLEHEHVFEIQAVIVPTAHAHGVFLQISLPRRGFAGIQNAHARAFDGPGKAPGGIGHARQVADEIHDHPLGLEQNPCRGTDPGRFLPADEDIAVRRKQVYPVFGTVHAVQYDGDKGQTGHDGVFFGHNHRVQQ